MTWATVTLNFEMNDEQVKAAQERAALLDSLNIGGTDAPSDYTPSQAMARILASDEHVTHPLCSRYTDGYTAEPVEEEA